MDNLWDTFNSSYQSNLWYLYIVCPPISEFATSPLLLDVFNPWDFIGLAYTVCPKPL